MASFSVPMSLNGKTDGQDDYYTLIERAYPVSAGHQISGLKYNSEEDTAAALKHLAETHDRLKELFQYDNWRGSEIEEAFYIKPLFILNNRSPKGLKEAREAVLILATDQDYIFKDGDDAYYSRYLNSSALSKRKRIANARDEAKKSIQDQWLSFAVQSVFDDSLSEKGVEDVKRGIWCVLQDAAKRRISAYQWLYSREHVKLSDSNRDYYIECYRSWPDGYYKANKPTPSDSELNDYIGVLLDEKNPWRTEMLNMPLCRIDLREIWRRNGFTKTIPDVVCDVIVQCLVEYIHQDQMAQTPFPEEGRTYVDDARIVLAYPNYKRRYDKLLRLLNATKTVERDDLWFKRFERSWSWGLVQSHANRTAYLVFC